MAECTGLLLEGWIDGGSRGNPGPAAAGVVLGRADGTELYRAGVFLGRTTNNVAEYRALLHALQVARRLGATGLKIHADSELLVRQINGKYNVKSRSLKPLFEQANALIAQFQDFGCTHLYRESNHEADRLANQAMDAVGDVIELDQQDDRSVVLAEAVLSEPPTLGGESQRTQVLLDADHAKVILMAMRAGHQIGAHHSKHPLTVQVLRGTIVFTAGRTDREMKPGDWIALPAAALHALSATTDAAVLVTLIR